MSKEDLNDLKRSIKWCRTRIALQAEEQRDCKTKVDGNNIRCGKIEEEMKENKTTMNNVKRELNTMKNNLKI